MCGLGEIDISDWCRNINYCGEYGDKYYVIVWFWKVNSDYLSYLVICMFFFYLYVRVFV